MNPLNVYSFQKEPIRGDERTLQDLWLVETKPVSSCPSSDTTQWPWPLGCCVLQLLLLCDVVVGRYCRPENQQTQNQAASVHGPGHHGQTLPWLHPALFNVSAPPPWPECEVWYGPQVLTHVFIPTCAMFIFYAVIQSSLGGCGTRTRVRSWPLVGNDFGHI